MEKEIKELQRRLLSNVSDEDRYNMIVKGYRDLDCLLDRFDNENDEFCKMIVFCGCNEYISLLFDQTKELKDKIKSLDALNNLKTLYLRLQFLQIQNLK